MQRALAQRKARMMEIREKRRKEKNEVEGKEG